MRDWANNLCKDPIKEIVAGINAAGSVLEKKRNSPKIIVCGLLPRDECWYMNRVIIK